MCTRAFRKARPPRTSPKAHSADVKTQDQYRVNYLKYWVDEQGGKVFCLVEAPDAETAIRVHREAHGLVADRIHQVEEGS
jgi:hypothetical protein